MCFLGSKGLHFGGLETGIYYSTQESGRTLQGGDIFSGGGNMEHRMLNFEYRSLTSLSDLDIGGRVF
jgi:hypothetical protein